MSGVPMYFVRTNLCNLRCRWCDTTYSFSGGTDEKLDFLVMEALEVWEKWICLTGGEPMLQREAVEYMNRVTEGGKHILLETGGSLDISKVVKIKETVIDMDIKCPSSGEHGSTKLSNLNFLRDTDYIKFVIQDQTDLQYAVKFLEDHRPECSIVFQPTWGTASQWLASEILKLRLDVRLMLQEHKYIFGDKRGV